MRIAILTTGSRGDVQPLIALGLGLQKAGHHVKLVTHPPFQDMIQNYGLEFAAMGGDVQAIMAQEAGQQMLESRNPVQLIRRYTQMIQPLLAEAMADSWKACQEIDLIISTPYTTWGFDIVQKLKIPFFMAALLPQSSNPDFPFPSIPQNLKLGGWFNAFSYPVMLEGFGWMFRKEINQFRQKTLQLPPLSIGEGLYSRMQRSKIPYLYGFSETLIPKPANWSEELHVTGYWFLEHLPTWTPSQELQAFLASGSPPVYIGFGSMTGRNPQQITEIALAALAQTKQRGILLTGWGGMKATQLPETVFHLESIPHDWLFRQMAAIIHHGGAGTSAAALQAGVPSVVVPFFADQPFWGYRLWKLGVSPAPIPKSSLSVSQLANAINTTLNDSFMRQKAQVIGEKIQAENGVQNAVKAIESSLSAPKKFNGI